MRKESGEGYKPGEMESNAPRQFKKVTLVGNWYEDRVQSVWADELHENR